MSDRQAFNNVVGGLDKLPKEWFKEDTPERISVKDPNSSLRMLYDKIGRYISISYTIGNTLSCLLLGPDYSVYDEFDLA